jgi:hypothetical protein
VGEEAPDGRSRASVEGVPVQRGGAVDASRGVPLGSIRVRERLKIDQRRQSGQAMYRAFHKRIEVADAPGMYS